MKRILIIEDEVSISEELSVLLNNAGHKAICVEDYSKVLDIYKIIQPDLVLLDINLPENNGFTICTKIRNISKAPIIFITGRDTSIDELRAFSLGGDDYITKPYNAPILLARVSSVLKRSEAQKTEILDARVVIQVSNGLLFIESLPILYIAFILCIVGMVILVSNILSDQTKYKRQFSLLRNLGYSRRKLENIIILQLCILFIVPVIPAIILNAILSPIYARSMRASAFVPRSELWESIILAYGIYMAIYFIYIIATFLLLRKSVLTNKEY